MSSLPRYAIVLALGISWAMFDSTANSQTKSTKKVATSTIAGRVVIRGKGAPGILVVARAPDYSPQLAPVLKAITDQDGNYRIADVSAGNYQVTPVAPAYTIPELMISGSFRGKPLLIAEGEEVQGVDFSLVRGGVVTGKIADADGRPVIEEQLMVVPEDPPSGRIQIQVSSSESFQTDDRGIYRIYGLAAGRYKISIGVSESDTYPTGRVGRVAYKRTFYPDATDPKEAKVVEVAEGSEVTNIDIIVGRNLPRFAASGKIVDGENGQPVSGMRLGLRRMVYGNEGPFVMGISAVSNSQGEFRLENVNPGKYALYIAPQANTETRAEASFFEIVNQDVTELLLKTIKGLSISGTVVLDGAYDKSVFAKLAQLRLQAYVRNELSGSGQNSVINPDGSFSVGGLVAGTANFWIVAENGPLPAGFTILRVERDGVAQPRGVEIKAGEQVDGVKIVVGYGTGKVRGEVKLLEGALPSDVRVSVWLKKSGDTEPNSRSYNVDARGHFLIEGVAAGSYELNVHATISGRRSAIAKQPVNVTEGAVSEVVVVVDLKATPEPNQ